MEEKYKLIGVHSRVLEEYERWTKKVGEDPFYDCTISVMNVLKAHFLIADYFLKEGEGLGGVGPKDLNLLFSAVSRQTVGYGSAKKWTDPIDICATLFYGLDKAHAFHDANKRTALLILLFFLNKIGRKPIVKQKELEDLAVHVAENSLTENYKAYNRKEFSRSPDKEVLIISRFLRRNTEKIDHQQQTITYNQLGSILNKFGYYYGKQHGASLEILRDFTEIKTRYFFRKEEIKVTRRVATVTFPGYKNQVPLGILKNLRDELGLTPRKGYDSNVFFGDASPMPALIDQYNSAFQRLAFR